MHTRPLLLLSLLFSLSTLTACKETVDPFSGTHGDAGPDTGAKAGPEAGIDLGPDTGEEPTCPASRPTAGDACNLADELRRCPYVVEPCACGGDLNEYFSCQDGEWTYEGRDYDCNRCPDGGVDGGERWWAGVECGSRGVCPSGTQCVQRWGSGCESASFDCVATTRFCDPGTCDPFCEQDLCNGGSGGVYSCYGITCGDRDPNAFPCGGPGARESRDGGVDGGDGGADPRSACDACGEGTRCVQYWDGDCDPLGTYCIETELECAECSLECKIELCNEFTPGAGEAGPYGCSSGGCSGTWDLRAFPCAGR